MPNLADIPWPAVGLLAALGVGIGVVVGGVAPLALGAWVKEQLPVPALFALYPGPLLKAAAFGLLSAAAFSLVAERSFVSLASAVWRSSS